MGDIMCDFLTAMGDMWDLKIVHGDGLQVVRKLDSEKVMIIDFDQSYIIDEDLDVENIGPMSCDIQFICRTIRTLGDLEYRKRSHSERHIIPKEAFVKIFPLWRHLWNELRNLQSVDNETMDVRVTSADEVARNYAKAVEVIRIFVRTERLTIQKLQRGPKLKQSATNREA